MQQNTNQIKLSVWIEKQTPYLIIFNFVLPLTAFIYFTKDQKKDFLLNKNILGYSINYCSGDGTKYVMKRIRTLSLRSSNSFILNIPISLYKCFPTRSSFDIQLSTTSLMQDLF